MATHVKYILNRTGKEWTCTNEEWQAMEQRMRDTGKPFARLVGPFNPVTVAHIEPKEIGVQAPVELSTRKGKRGASGHEQDEQNA